MTRVQVSLRIPGTAPMPELIQLIQGVEAAGFDGAGILDSQLLCRDTFVTMALASAHTSGLTLFPAVTNPLTRHASVLASAIQTVEEIAPGRIKVVVGTGYTSAHTIGRKPATLAEMRVCIGTLRALLAGEAVTFGQTSGSLGYASGRRRPVLTVAPRARGAAGAGSRISKCAGRFASGSRAAPRRRADRRDRPSCIRPCSAHGRTGSRTPASRFRGSTSRRRFGPSTPIWPTRATGSRRSRRRRSFRMTGSP